MNPAATASACTNGPAPRAAAKSRMRAANLKRSSSAQTATVISVDQSSIQ